jgi:hypothetical protein
MLDTHSIRRQPDSRRAMGELVYPRQLVQRGRHLRVYAPVTKLTTWTR